MFKLSFRSAEDIICFHISYCPTVLSQNTVNSDMNSLMAIILYGWRTLPCPTYSRWTLPESRCIFLAGSTPKLACFIYLDFTRTPGGLQMNHMESVESTCQIAVWILPGLNPWSIHLESRRSLFIYITLLLIVVIKQKVKVTCSRIQPKTMGIHAVMQPTAPQQHLLPCKSMHTWYLFGPYQIRKCQHKLCHTSLPFNHHCPAPPTAH